MAALHSIKDYPSLLTAISEELNRQSDSVLVARIPDWVFLAEQDIRRRQKFFTERYSIAQGGIPLPVTTQPFQLPDYVRRVKTMNAASSSYRHPITLVTRADLAARKGQNLSGAWNQPMPGIPVIAVIEPQMGSWMGAGGAATGIGPWVDFWPSPTGTPVPGAGGAVASATIVGGVVTAVAVTNGGAGYDVNNPPSVMFIGGGPGTGAAATVTITAGQISAVTVTAGGSGYTSAPTVAFAGFAIDLTYVRDLPPLETSQTGANGVLLLHPDVYLYGALKHSAPWLQHDDRVVTWSQLYEDGLKKMNVEVEEAEQSAVPKRARFRAFA